MTRLIIAALALSLLICAVAWGGVSDYVNTAHARSIPWDCSDWQASAAVEDAEDERVSVILESLATNRGKTLYCAVDQSDTFTKAETWQAGKDRNERDDTVYYGANGRFRGFLAAQEGYLTDGESGVTGISRDRIFEFPEEERRRRRWRWVEVTESLDLPAEGETLLSGTIVVRSGDTAGDSNAKRIAERMLNGFNRAVNPGICGPANNNNLFAQTNPTGERCRDTDFATWTQTAAEGVCATQGYERAVNTVNDPASEVWEYTRIPPPQAAPTTFNYDVRRTRTYTTTCERTVRKRVRR